MAIEIPYPPVFRDWREHRGYDRRVATAQSATGVVIEMSFPSGSDNAAPTLWHGVEMTEQDAALLAASLLQRAGYNKLSRKVVKKLNKDEAACLTS